MSKKKEEKEEKKEVSLLEELCGDDAELQECLSNNLLLDPLAALSEKDLNILTEEGEKSGDFRPAMDKAIFVGSQNPGERERYIRVVQNLALKSIHTMEQKLEKAEKEGLADQAMSLKRIIKNQKFMSERAEDIINTASKFYKEILVERGESQGKEERAAERSVTEAVEWRTAQEEKERREAAKKERRGMGREEKREAEKQEIKEEMAAEEKKEAREQKRKEVEKEEGIIGEREKEGREARKKDRMGN
jgi:hypothetical protein